MTNESLTGGGFFWITAMPNTEAAPMSIDAGDRNTPKGSDRNRAVFFALLLLCASGMTAWLAFLAWGAGYLVGAW